MAVVRAPERVPPLRSAARFRRRRAVALLVAVLAVVGVGSTWSRYESVRQVRAAAETTAQHVAVWRETDIALDESIAAAREVLADAQGKVADRALLSRLSEAITVADTVAPAAAIRRVPDGANVQTARSMERVAGAVVARQQRAADALADAVSAVREACADADADAGGSELGPTPGADG